MRDFLPVIIPTVALFLAALLLGRRWLLLVPLSGWPLVFLGLYMGWWGYGVGDGWQFMVVLWALVGVAAVGLGLVLESTLPPALRSGSHHRE